MTKTAHRLMIHHSSWKHSLSRKIIDSIAKTPESYDLQNAMQVERTCGKQKGTVGMRSMWNTILDCWLKKPNMLFFLPLASMLCGIRLYMWSKTQSLKTNPPRSPCKPLQSEYPSATMTSRFYLSQHNQFSHRKLARLPSSSRCRVPRT